MRLQPSCTPTFSHQHVLPPLPPQSLIEINGFPYFPNMATLRAFNSLLVAGVRKTCFWHLVNFNWGGVACLNTIKSLLANVFSCRANVLSVKPTMRTRPTSDSQESPIAKKKTNYLLTSNTRLCWNQLSVDVERRSFCSLWYTSYTELDTSPCDARNTQPLLVFTWHACNALPVQALV